MSVIYQALLDLLAGIPLLNGYEQKIQGVFTICAWICLGVVIAALWVFYRSENVNYTLKTWRKLGLLTSLSVGIICFLTMILSLSISKVALEQLIYMIVFGVINIFFALLLYWGLSYIGQMFSTNYHHIPSSPFKNKSK